jgi:membrane-associated phospholipid phosphatase
MKIVPARPPGRDGSGARIWRARSRAYVAASSYVEARDRSTQVADAQPLARALAEIGQACGRFEQTTFAYLTWILALIAVFHHNIPHAARLASLHILIAAAIAQFAWSAARSQNPALQFARHFYPLPLYIFFFEELQYLVHAIFPSWFDRWLIQFDYNLAGIHPSVWLARFANPALNDAMQFAYMTYFLYLVILPAILYAQKDRVAFWTVMTSTAIAHYSVYVIAVLLPVESPYFALAALNPTPLRGGAFTAAIELIEHFGRVHGAAFPSAHVAGSTVAILAARHYKPWLFWLCLPFFTAMCVATVYGRYHYVADVLAGLAVGAMAWSTGRSRMDRSGATQGFQCIAIGCDRRQLAAAQGAQPGNLRKSSPAATTFPPTPSSRCETPTGTGFHCVCCRTKTSGIPPQSRSTIRCKSPRRFGSETGAG